MTELPLIGDYSTPTTPLSGARIGVITFPGTLDDVDALRAVRLAGAEPVSLWHADADPQRQGVDKHPQGAVGTLAALHTAQQHGAEHHPLAVAGHAQYPCPGQVEQAGQADTGGLGLATQPLDLSLIHI